MEVIGLRNIKGLRNLEQLFSDPINITPGVKNDFGSCWICGSKDSQHEHHVIPRAYGGEKGPTVVICSPCHDRVHSLDIISGKCNDETWDDSHRKIYYLQHFIQKAKRTVDGDPNKTTSISIRMPAHVDRRLTKLAKYLGKNKADTMMSAVMELHKKFFGE